MGLLAIPTYGSPSDFSEDKYSTFFENPRGCKVPTYPHEVVLSCPNKHVRIRGPLCAPFQMSAQSEWDEMFGGGIASVGGGIIGTVNNALQWTSGETLQQPWMNRKIYKNTKPFSFTLNLAFVSPNNGHYTDSCEWVAKPCVALFSLLYPRDLGKKLFGDSDKTGVAGSFKNLMKLYAIPGPGLRASQTNTMYGTSKDEEGDAVNVMVGNMFNFGNCYVNSVGITLSDAFDEKGLPIAAKAVVQVTCADQVLCDANGDFNVNHFPDSAAELGALLDSIAQTTENIKQNLVATFKAWKGAMWVDRSKSE